MAQLTAVGRIVAESCAYLRACMQPADAISVRVFGIVTANKALFRLMNLVAICRIIQKEREVGVKREVVV